MTSCSILERESRARGALLAAAALLLLAPATLTLAHGAGAVVAGAGMGGHFLPALGNSLAVAIGASVIGLLLGLPAGLVLGLYRVPAGRGLTIALALPLLLPGFLPAIGLHRLALAFNVQLAEALEGRIGCILVASGPAAALVALAVISACRALPGSALDAARLAGGERAVLATSAWRILSPALAAALLAAALGLVDAGPAQVLGIASAAGEIQLAFAQDRSYAAAGARCFAMAGAALLLATPIVVSISRARGAAHLTRATVAPAHHDAPIMRRALLMLPLVVAWILLPLVGLALPMIHGVEAGKAAEVLARTWSSTLVYALGSAAFATASAWLLVLISGRGTRLHAGLLALALVMLALPPQSWALGFLVLGSAAPTNLDPVLRSRFTVCIALALRSMPVAVVLLLARWRTFPVSLTLAGAVHGVGLGVFTRSVLLPYFARALLAAFMVCALLASAQIDIVHLLHPPGEPSLPLAVLTVLANTRESVGASLCLLEIVLAALILVSVSRLGVAAR